MGASLLEEQASEGGVENLVVNIFFISLPFIVVFICLVFFFFIIMMMMGGGEKDGHLEEEGPIATLLN